MKEDDPTIKLTDSLDTYFKAKDELREGCNDTKTQNPAEYELYKEHILTVIENTLTNYKNKTTNKEIDFINNVLTLCNSVILTGFKDDLNLKKNFKRLKEIAEPCITYKKDFEIEKVQNLLIKIKNTLKF